MPAIHKHLTAGDPYPPLEAGKLRIYSMELCPYAQRSRLLLLLKKIPHEVVNINIVVKPEWYPQKINPLSKVPAIERDDVVVFDSVIVNEYLDSVYPGEKFTPTDPLQLARDKMLLEQWNKVTVQFYQIFNSTGEDTAAITDLFNALDAIEADLRRRKSVFFGGDKPSMLDIHLFPHAERICLYPSFVPDMAIDKTRFKSFLTYIDAMTSHPVVKETATKAEEFHEFSLSYKEKTMGKFYGS